MTYLLWEGASTPMSGESGPDQKKKGVTLITNVCRTGSDPEVWPSLVNRGERNTKEP